MITAPCLINSARVIQLQRAWQYCSLIIPAWYFSFGTFQSASFFINKCQTWTIFHLWRKNEVSKCKWENSSKVCVYYVPHNCRIWNYDPYTQVQSFSFWGVYSNLHTAYMHSCTQILLLYWFVFFMSQFTKCCPFLTNKLLIMLSIFS